MVNEQDDGPRDAVRAIKKRLQLNAGKNHTVVMHTLIVMNSLKLLICENYLIGNNLRFLRLLSRTVGVDSIYWYAARILFKNW